MHINNVYSAKSSDIFSYHGQTMYLLFYLGQNFLIVDLWDFFSDLGSGDRKKKKF